MQIYNRQKDLSEVFDETWRANHNDDIKKARTKEKEFMNKMFDVKKKQVNNNFGLPTNQQQLQRRQDNINSMNNFNNQTKLNNIKGRFN